MKTNAQNPTALKPADVQVLFADLQKQIVARSKTNEPKTLTKAATALGQLTQVFSIPVTISLVAQGGQDPELIPELEKEVKGAPQFVRMSPNPFLHEQTKAALEANGRKTLLIAGCATEIVVLHSVTSAIENGYRVLVAIDACGGISERTEQSALRQIEAFGGEVTSVMTIATSLEPDFTSAQGQEMFKAIQPLLRD